MSQYEGLNLPQLLDLMYELALPEPVSWMPQTAGWWILLAWLLVMGVLGAWRIGSHRRRNRYRREALRTLAVIESQADHRPGKVASQVAALLKRTALVAYPRRQVAKLHGTDWARFLCQSANDDAQIIAAADALAMAAYRPDVDGAELCEPARRWIKVHRA